MSGCTPPVRSILGVALNASIDRTVAVDRLEPGAIHRPTVLSSVAGGKAANAVRAAASLGLPARVLGVVGGHAGAWYADALRRLNVELIAIDTEGETRTCLSVLDRSTGQLTEFYEPGLAVPAELWPRIESTLADALGPEAEACLVLLAGSLPPGGPDDAYRRLGSICAERDAAWVVDAAGAPLLEALEADPWLVKVNEREAAETLGFTRGDDTAAALDLAGQLLERGARNVLLTRGLEGAVLRTRDGAWVLGPPPLTGPYSVGSGDALVAGLAVALSRRQQLPEAVRYGSGVAAANALVPGQGVLELDRVDDLAVAISLTAAAEAPQGQSPAAR